jgi:hypothetical protein
MGVVVHITSAGAQWCKKTPDGWVALEPSDHDVSKPVWVVTDLAEETFSELAVPRIFGKDRSSFVNRQLANRYPDSVFRIALPAAQVGGMMDRLAPPQQTLTAIDPSDRVELALARIKAPVAGVWSASMLMARLAQRPTLPKNMFVILSQEHALRILFVKNRVPVLTRLVTTAQSPQEQATEVVRTLRHLENTHVIERGKERFALMLLGGNEELKKRLNDDQLTVLESPKKWEHFPQIGWNYLLFEAALKSPLGQLAPMKYRISYLARQTTKAAWVGSAAVIVLAVVTASLSILSARDAQQQQQALQQQLSEIAVASQNTEELIAQYGVPPASVKQAVALDTQEIENIPNMTHYMVKLGEAMAPYPALRVQEWQWRVAEAEDAVCVSDDPSQLQAESTETSEAEPEAPSRKVELRWTIAFPAELGPYGLEQQMSAISKAVQGWSDAKLMLDPVIQLQQADISIASTAAGQAQRNMKWCMAVPIKNLEQP